MAQTQQGNFPVIFPYPTVSPCASGHLPQVLEDALSGTIDDGGSTGAYPYAAGLRFSVNASRPAGSRIFDVELRPRGNSSSSSSWVALEPGAAGSASNLHS